MVPKSANAARIESNFDMLWSLNQDEDARIASLMGPRGEHGVRNLVNHHHVGFDVFDEFVDQPVAHL